MNIIYFHEADSPAHVLVFWLINDITKLHEGETAETSGLTETVEFTTWIHHISKLMYYCIYLTYEVW